MDTLGPRIRKIRDMRRLTQKALASKAGISEVALQCYELGTRRPKQEQLIKSTLYSVYTSFKRKFIINKQERERKMEEMKKIDEVHKAYEICKEVFSPTVGIIEAGSEIEDKEEYEFYKMAHEFFFQKRQKELIAKGIY